MSEFAQEFSVVLSGIVTHGEQARLPEVIMSKSTFTCIMLGPLQRSIVYFDNMAQFHNNKSETEFGRGRLKKTIQCTHFARLISFLLHIYKSWFCFRWSGSHLLQYGSKKASLDVWASGGLRGSSNGSMGRKMSPNLNRQPHKFVLSWGQFQTSS
jgi:hypothetical protein